MMVRWQIVMVTMVLLGWINGRISAQDAHFSQFYANPLYLSPSLAGATDGGRIILNYRNQWPAITKAYSTYSASFDNFFPTFNSGIGVYVMRDRAGSAGLTTTNAAFQYSYNLQINKQWQVIPGIQFEYGNKAIDLSKVKLGYDLSFSGGSSSWERLNLDQVHYFDLATSAFLYNPKYWVGFSLHHLTQPNYSFMGQEMKIPLKATLFGGMNIWTERNRRALTTRSFSWSFRYQHQQQFKQLDAGMYWHNTPFELGLWYRGLPLLGEVETVLNHDAIVALVAWEYGPFRIGYSYDITISKLGWNTAGAHELSLIYEFNQRFSLRAGSHPPLPCSKTANPLDSKKPQQQRKRTMF